MVPLHTPRWTGWWGLILGLGLVALAVAMRWLLDRYLENQFPFSIFVLITAITAWVAGWRNAAVTHLAGLFAGTWFFVGPRYELGEASIASVWGTIFFISIGVVICFFTARWQVSAELARKELHEREKTQRALMAAQAELRAHATELEGRVQVRTRELGEALGRLQSFTYSMVHDMRAPLRAISSFAMILDEEFTRNPDARGCLKRLHGAAQRLDDLITDLQSYSETASREAVVHPLELEGIVNDILEEYPPLRESRKHIYVQRPLPGVCANAALITQALAHLLTNALKFVPPSRTPEVHLFAEARDGTVRIWVTDNGIGIEPQYHGKIFGIFEQLHPPGTYSGTGMGLAIAKRAVERMGGNIGFESTPGSGSRFWIELRAVEASNDEIERRIASPSQRA